MNRILCYGDSNVEQSEYTKSELAVALKVKEIIG